MSDLPTDFKDRLDLREQIERIDRAREEARKFTAEQHKLMEEGAKLAAEQHKLMEEGAKLAAEAAKFNRERAWMPLLNMAGTVGGLIALISFAIQLLGYHR